MNKTYSDYHVCQAAANISTQLLCASAQKKLVREHQSHATTGRKPKAFYISFYQAVLKLNIMTTAALIGDWKPVKEQHIPLLCERNQGTECYVPTSVSYTTLPRSLCTLWYLIHLAQKLQKRWRCSRPMQRRPPLLVSGSDLKVSILSTLGATTSKVNNSGENYCTATMNSSSVPCLTSLSLVTGTTVARRLQVSRN